MRYFRPPPTESPFIPGHDKGVITLMIHEAIGKYLIGIPSRGGKMEEVVNG